ncbi:GNAT family N-acetyltransferase [Oceanobacillus salinisoli]|uniref:GNAT family N-acetyltransferase n=1 Tax=Oceanobacillus salinisoli TaxID=2678611 RepID=UPI0012E1CE51|nr:GNAT family protein [Oceanobacillus salinisoli]
MGEFPKLETKRLYLLQVSQRYKRDLYEILSLDEVTKYYGKENLESIDEATDLIDNFYRLFQQNRSIRWGMVLKDTEQFIGTVGLNNLNLLNKKGEIGYELHPTYWRRGITSEAVREVLSYAFNKLGLFRIGAVTFPENIASNQLLKKMGFKQEGLLRGYLHQNNQSHDAVMHSLLKPEWTMTKNEDGKVQERIQLPII